MQDPMPKFVLCIGAVLIGTPVGIYGLVQHARLGDDPAALVPMLGGALVALIGVAFGIHFGRAVYGQAQLRAGRDLVARWWVSAADWNRFRAFDDAREPYAHSDLRYRPRTRPDGIEVIVGERALMVDGSWHLVQGKISSEVPSGICWFEVAPCCIEIVWTMQTKNSTLLKLVRLPVPEAARAQGERVFDHFKAMIPEGRREWMEENFDYDFGARMPKGFEAGREVPVQTVFANRTNRKRRDAGFLIAYAGAAIAAMAWYVQFEDLLPRPWAGGIAIGVLSVAILAAGFTLIFTRRDPG